MSVYVCVCVCVCVYNLRASCFRTQVNIKNYQHDLFKPTVSTLLQNI